MDDNRQLRTSTHASKAHFKRQLFLIRKDLLHNFKAMIREESMESVQTQID